MLAVNAKHTRSTGTVTKVCTLLSDLSLLSYSLLVSPLSLPMGFAKVFLSDLKKLLVLMIYY